MFIVPCDVATDCNDLFELACGQRGIPSDKSQRLAVLSIREDRLSGRTRAFFHWPTSIMLAGALTKPGTFPQMMRFLSTGVFEITDFIGDRHIKRRVLLPPQDFDEQALVDMTY